MMCKEDSGNYNILITKDLLTMQLAALYPRTIIFRPKKYNGEDISVFVSPLNNGLYKYACDKRKTNYPLSDTDNISAGLYSLFLAGTRLPERDMKSLLSIPVMLREINSVVQLPDVLNGYNTDVEKFCEKMTPKTYVTLQRGNISSRFKAIDTIYQYGIFANTPEAKMYQGCANLYDPNGIHQIDTEYFSKCHLQLEYL
jgi:hypothetical protein